MNAACRALSHIALIVCALTVCLGCGKGGRETAARPTAIDIATTNRLWHLWQVLNAERAERDRLPSTLSEVAALNSVDLNLFICPGTGSQTGSIATVEDWTDYIYVGGVWDGVPLTAAVISPPENHQRKYGYVLCIGGWLKQLPPAQIKQIIREPWLLDTNATGANIDYLKRGISVRIPKRFEKEYGLLSRSPDR